MGSNTASQCSVIKVRMTCHSHYSPGPNSPQMSHHNPPAAQVFLEIMTFEGTDWGHTWLPAPIIATKH